ncbi:hypothetical protein EDC45_0268 [Mesocricetibacter intestinalis]|uniref:DUF484 family protein n=1 Tax=Mesocricetibacter intestinalis TaxID=1521930 RepID=A0A4R6VFR5_9PAST|nr:DUF484 family protein [Mesocricetibacter intestinalis]TDQ59611.1 hypothetical protein EDC45_0268 [Mesocricetibacter intestinalis]
MNDLNEQQVADYLSRHPDFFNRHPTLLDKLKFSEAHKGVLSLVEVQLERQRRHIRELESELDKFARLANKEPDIFLGLMPLQQKLSAAENFSRGLQKLNQWATEFELQQAKILLFNDRWQKNPDVAPQYWLDRNAFEWLRLERFGLRRFYLGELSNREKSLIFLPQELPVGSVACCQLGNRNGHQPDALLLFAAHDTRRFHNSQDTAFLKHLADIVELHLQRWLAPYKN